MENYGNSTSYGERERRQRCDQFFKKSYEREKGYEPEVIWSEKLYSAADAVAMLNDDTKIYIETKRRFINLWQYDYVPIDLNKVSEIKKYADGDDAIIYIAECNDGWAIWDLRWNYEIGQFKGKVNTEVGSHQGEVGEDTCLKLTWNKATTFNQKGYPTKKPITHTDEILQNLYNQLISSQNDK